MNTTERKTSFVTVYLPKNKVLRDLIWKQSQGNISVSGQILKLVAADLRSMGLISETEHDQILNFKFHRATNTERDHHNNNYSLYIPKDLWWVLAKVDDNIASKLKPDGAIPHPNRSRYIWHLFNIAFSQPEIRQAG